MFKFIMMLTFAISIGAHADSGLVKVVSVNSVKGTMDKLELKLKEKGMTIFKRISHSEGAKKIGKSLRDTELLIFGNPKLGSKLMNCNQEIGLDLPLKMLSWKDKKGKVWLAYNKISNLENKYGIKICGQKVFKKMKKALKGFVQFATK